MADFLQIQVPKEYTDTEVKIGYSTSAVRVEMEYDFNGQDSSWVDLDEAKDEVSEDDPTSHTYSVPFLENKALTARGFVLTIKGYDANDDLVRTVEITITQTASPPYITFLESEVSSEAGRKYLEFETNLPTLSLIAEEVPWMSNIRLESLSLLSFTVARNLDKNPRSFGLTLSNPDYGENGDPFEQYVDITQLSPPNWLMCADSAIMFDITGGSAEIVIQTNIEDIAESDVPAWLTVSHGRKTGVDQNFVMSVLAEATLEERNSSFTIYAVEDPTIAITIQVTQIKIEGFLVIGVEDGSGRRSVFAFPSPGNTVGIVSNGMLYTRAQGKSHYTGVVRAELAETRYGSIDKYKKERLRKFLEKNVSARCSVTVSAMGGVITDKINLSDSLEDEES